MKCPNCQYDPTMSEIQRSPADCVKCGIHYDAFYKEQAAAAARASVVFSSGKHGEAQPVIVMDIDMKFWSMVKFMVKWAIAAIPAFVILVLIGTAVFTLLTGFIASYSTYSNLKAAKEASQRHASSQPSDLGVIFTPGEKQGRFTLLSLRFEGRRGISTIQEKTGNGYQYSLFIVDCRNGIAEVVSTSNNFSKLTNDPRIDLKTIKPGTDRHAIAIRVCRDYPERHPSL